MSLLAVGGLRTPAPARYLGRVYHPGDPHHTAATSPPPPLGGRYRIR